MEYNDRYIAYAKCQGRSADEMKKHDISRGNGMRLYMNWIESKKKEFCNVNPDCCGASGLKGHEEFTQFLLNQAENNSNE